MKTRVLTMMVLAAVASAASGQQRLSKEREANGPVNVPGWPLSPLLRDVELPANGACQSVRYGDIVHFTLRIENAQDAKVIFTDLQMGLGKHPKFRRAMLRVPEADSMGGGGVGVRDASDYRLYHFRFAVPDVAPGIYRTAGIDVRASYGRLTQDGGVGVPLDKPTRAKVERYCLAVFGEGGGHAPIVTDFLPGAVEHPAAPPERPVFP